VIALAVANTRQVKLSWVVGTSHASLVWTILVGAVLGWLLRDRHQRHRPPADATPARHVAPVALAVASTAPDVQ